MVMKKKIFWIVVSCLMALSLVMASCGPAEEEEEVEVGEEEVVITEEEEEEEEVTEEKAAPGPEVPKYGGTITLRLVSAPSSFDPYMAFLLGTGFLVIPYYMESLAMNDYTVDRAIFDFKSTFVPPECWTGCLAESWELPDLQTIIYHIRKGVRWQDKPPVNGRELTAYDCEYSFHRVLGLGSGFNAPSPFIGTNYAEVKSVTATDKYTLVVKLKTPSFTQLSQMMEELPIGYTVAREMVEKWGGLNDWRAAIGTGPFTLTDYVTGSSVTLVRNPTYWMTDPFSPGNSLPYVDKVTFLIIPDMSTALAGLRTGKIDMDGVSWEQALSLKRTNPELKWTTRNAMAPAILMQVDKKPFADIRVRRAMQMAIDLKTIAQTYYGGTADPTPMGLVGEPGYYLRFDEWPQEVKEGYTFNPEGAKNLLAEAGYPEGFKCTVAAAATSDLDLLQLLKAYLDEVGIDMAIEVRETGAHSAYTNAGYAEMTYGGGFNYGTFIGWAPPRALEQCCSAYLAKAKLHNIKDPVFDELWSKCDAASTVEELKRTSIEADFYAIKQQWYVHIFPYVTYTAWQPYIMRYQGESGIGVGHIASQLMWIDQDLKKSIGR
jgi:peptide/nickel transport system substrate-binding protein